MKRTVLRSLIAVIILLFGYLLLWPVPINPAAWTPPPAPELTGVYAQNSELSRIERLRIDGNRPEDVAFDSQDRIYCGDDRGRIFRFQPDGTKPELFADQPHGLLHYLVARPAKETIGPAVDEQVAAGNQRFWQQRWAQTLTCSIRDTLLETRLGTRLCPPLPPGESQHYLASLSQLRTPQLPGPSI